MNTSDCIASFKFEGKLVEGGVLDAKAASRALAGIDSSIKFFVAQEIPELVAVDIPIPVKVQDGSWEALIPTDLLAWIKTVGGIAATTYLATAAKKLAEHDFKDKGIKDVLRGAIDCIQWLIKIGKHVRHLALRNLKSAKLDMEGFIGLLNEAKEVLYVPLAIFRRIQNCPKQILSDLASVVEVERSLRISILNSPTAVSVEISRTERFIFFDESDDTEILFPNLVHGQQVELDGVVTRGNEMANTIGFFYDGHVLTCSPRTGNIVRFKTHLFLTCKIFGVISREDRKGDITENRPKIIFEDLQVIADKSQMLLGFDDSESIDG